MPPSYTMAGEPSRPLRKRRRPTLACHECRRRKVRCDRKNPCTQCTHHGLEGCSYDGDGEKVRAWDVLTFQTYTSSVGKPETNSKPAASLSHILKDSLHSGILSEAVVCPDSISSPCNDGYPSRKSAASAGSQFNSPPKDVLATDQPHSNSPHGPPHEILSNKTRVFGPGHWMTAFALVSPIQTFNACSYYMYLTASANSIKNKGYQSFAEISGAIQPNTGDLSRDISEAVYKCKEIARDIKARRPGRGPLPPSVLQSLPSRGIIDQLIPLYFDTIESCYRILHRQSFYREYEEYLEQPEAATSTFLLKMILLLSCVACFHEDASIRGILQKNCRSWIRTAEIWLSGPYNKTRLIIDGIQIYCLLLLSRQINLAGADLVWISAGSLMRMAIQMGLHQDPNHLGKMTLLEKELHRRLWFTILEINVQSALDSGMSAMISSTDYNTQPPSNFDDADLENTKQDVKPTPTFTQSSLQGILIKSLPLRLEAVKIINDLNSDHTYEEVLRLASELVPVCREAVTVMGSYRSTTGGNLISEFQHNSVDHFLRRFLLCLNRPYALRAEQNPLYSYSAKICLETAHNIISLLTDEKFRRMMLSGGGMYRDIMTYSAPIVFIELIAQLKEDGSELMKERNKARRQPLLDDARKIHQFAIDRILNGETNVKGCVFLSMAMGQVEALQSGTPVTDGIRQAANDCLALCYSTLKRTATTATPDAPADPEQWDYGSDKLLSEQYSTDAGIDFLEDGTLDFDAPGSWLFEGWEERSWV